MRRVFGSRAMRVAVLVVVVLVVAGGVWYVMSGGKKKVTAVFESTKGIYKDDSVRMLGVEVGTIDEIRTADGHAEVEMSVDRDVRIPESANALIVAQSLVAERFVQLTPVYKDGPELADGGTIPQERTAIPVEWDAVKEQLMSLSSALGPAKGQQKGSLGKFVDSADAMLDGNGERVRSALREVSHTMSVMSDGREDLFSTLRNLQLFVTALSHSQEQIVSFGGHLASVTQVLADQTSGIDAALKDLDLAVGDIQRFVGDNGPKLTTGIDKLGRATEVVRDRRADLEKLLHTAPTATANFYNIYRPYQGTLNGVLAMNQMSSPVDFICASITALANPSAQKDAGLCAQYLGPFLNTLTSNYPYGMAAPPYTPTAEPEQIQDLQKPGTRTPNGVQPVSATPADLTDVVNPGTDLTGLLVPEGGR